MLDTSNISVRQQLDFWVDAVCRTYTGMTVHKTGMEPAHHGFSGKMAVKDMGQISISSARAERSRVDRTRANISNRTADIFLL